MHEISFFIDDPFLSKLKGLGPSAVDAEFRCLSPDAGGEIMLMQNFMEFLIRQLESRKDFELIQGYMALFLKVKLENLCPGIRKVLIHPYHS